MLLDRIIELEAQLNVFNSRLRQLDPEFLDTHSKTEVLSFADQLGSASGSATPGPLGILPILAASSSGAFPRSLVSQRSQQAFVSNLKQAMSELDHEDIEIDPMLSSRHVGPAARKRQAAEEKERQELAEGRESKRKRGKAAAASAATWSGGSALPRNGSGNAPGK